MIPKLEGLRQRCAAAFDDRLTGRVDQFVVIEFLDGGGMGDLYRVREDGLDRELVMKVMSTRLRVDLRAESRFLREARITGMLQHPNIVPVYGRGTAKLPSGILVPYYTMRPLTGGTLARRLREDPSFSSGTVAHRIDAYLPIIEGVCDALVCAHRRGIVHRDVKPDNVMLEDGHQVLLCDWGLAFEPGSVGEHDAPQAVTDHAPGANRSEPGVHRPTAPGGTPAYAPPEQMDGSGPLGPWSDVYSLGAILAEILLGTFPSGDATSVLSGD